MEKHNNLYIYIYIYIISSALSMGKAVSCEKNMSGLYIGFGANVGYDEYDARANVGYQPANAIKSVTVDKAINGVTLKDGDSANNLVTQLWACGKDEKPKNIKYEDETDDKDEVIIVSSKATAGGEPVNTLYYCDLSSLQCKGSTSGPFYVLSKEIDDDHPYHLCNVYISVQNPAESKYKLDKANLHLYEDCKGTNEYCAKSDWCELTNYYYQLTDEPSYTDEYGTEGYPVKLYKKTGESIPQSVIKSDKATYLMSQSLNRSGHNAGGEMKMAYFHDFGNHVMAGLDLTGAVLSKNKRNVQVSKFNVNHEHPDLILKSGEDQIARAKYKNEQYETTVEGTKTIVANSPLTLSVDTDSLKGMHVTSDPIKGEYLDVSNGDKEVSFEKGIFNPKLAFVVGGTYNGWFAGLRAGVSYNTGKIKAPDMTSSKSVSIASPLVGVQVMKKVSDNTNLYMTADWNVGDLRKSVDMNGIKSFKQSSYNISAGVQWRCNFMK